MAGSPPPAFAGADPAGMTEFFFAVSRLRENKKTVILREAKRSRRIQIPML